MEQDTGSVSVFKSINKILVAQTLFACNNPAPLNAPSNLFV